MIDFFRELWTLGYRRNYWFDFHFLASLIGSALFLRYFASLASVLPVLNALGEVVALFLGIGMAAVAWEIIEYKADDVAKIYGSKRRFFFDAAGDIIAALLAAAVALI